MMPYRQTDDLSIDRVDVGQVAFHSTGMRDRELGVDSRIEVLLGEQPPIRDKTVILLTGQLTAPRAVVEAFVASKEQCRDRAAEAERIAPIIGGNQTTIRTDADLPPTIGPIDRQLSVGRPVSDADSEQRVG